MKLLACEICGDANYYCAECGTCFKCSAEDHEKQLQQAHREGWEQCQREAVEIMATRGTLKTLLIRNAIAAMKYKEPPNVSAG